MSEPRAADVATHAHPAWRERADHLLLADLTSRGMAGHWEQLWALRLSADRFEICCIPFFARGIRLGDTVASQAGREVGAVVARSGRHLVRADFGPTAPRDLHERLQQALTGLGIPNEWHGSGYLACSPANDAELTAAQHLLERYEARGYLQAELDP